MSDEVASTTAARRMDAPALTSGLVTVTAWGSAFVGIRAADQTLSPGALALGRLVVSTAILGGFALARREPLPRRRDLLAIVAYGIAFLGVYSATLNAAERLVDAGTGAMIINTGPLLIALLAGIFLREGFPRGLLAGCVGAFAGCVVIGLATIQNGARSGLGIVLCMVAVLAYSAAVVVQKPVLARVSPFQVTWLGCVAGAIACRLRRRSSPKWQRPTRPRSDGRSTSALSRRHLASQHGRSRCGEPAPGGRHRSTT